MKVVLWPQKESFIRKVGCLVFWTKNPKCTDNFVPPTSCFFLRKHGWNSYFACKPWFMLGLHGPELLILDTRVILTFKTQLSLLLYIVFFIFSVYLHCTIMTWALLSEIPLLVLCWIAFCGHCRKLLFFVT